jgi:hypothetical protein
LWGVELDAPETRSALDLLASALLDRRLVAEVVDALPPEAQAALEDLLRNHGRLPWSFFTRRYGTVREMGPARRDREKPYLSQISPAEILWYRALVGRAFFDSPAGPEEFAYVPDDLMRLLPVSQSGPLQPMGHPASPAERAVSILASDRILDDACTLLAALRLSLSSESFPIFRSSYPSSPYPLSPNPLKSLLSAANLLDPQGQPLPEPTRAFLEAERGAALAQLTRAWLDSRVFNELAQLPDLSLEGEWANDPLRIRRTLMEFLSPVPKEAWWSLEAFVAAIRQHYPDFQRPAGDYDSWFIRQRNTGEYLRGFEHWDAVDGALIRYLIAGPLHWLGIMDLAMPAEGQPVLAFRYSAWAVALLKGDPPVGLPPEEETILVKSDVRLRLTRRVPRAIRYQVARFCEWEGEEGEVYRYRLTPGSLGRARQQGLRVSHLLALLRRHASTVPPSLVKALERWEEHGSQASLESLLVLRLSSPEILKELRASRAARFLGEPLGPTAVIVKPGAREKVLAALAEMGYLSEATIEV